MYRGTVYIPSVLWRDNHPADMLAFTAEAIADAFHYKLIHMNQLNIDEIEGDTLFTIKSPQFAYPHVLDTIKKLPKSIRLISYFQDIHGGSKEFIEHSLFPILERANIVITAYRDTFFNKFPNIKYKTVYLPTFIAPTDRYMKMPINIKKKIKHCLIIGNTQKDFYPLRYEAVIYDNGLFDHVPHPGYHNISKKKDVFVGDAYAYLINKFVACLTDVSIQKYVVCKFFEIMGAGSILISNWCPEMDDLGFKDMENYVRIDNVHKDIEKIKKVLSDPEKYEYIIYNGREMVKKSHTVEKFVDNLKTIIG